MKFYLSFLLLSLSVTVLVGQNRSSEIILISSNKKRADLNPIPYLAIKYLDENFRDYFIIQSISEENGNQQVSIKYKSKTNKSLYKDLFFDSTGHIIQ